MLQADLDPALPTDVTGWDRLRRPIWLFDPASCRGLYANASALTLWDADDLGELLARDFSKLSPAVRTRVERLAAATAGGEAVSERWTFYPNGQPVTVQAVITSLTMADGRAALLFKAAPVDVEEGERRAVEALRHSSSLITLFDADGRPLFCNPAAFAAYGSDQIGFAERFADAGHGAQLLSRVQSGAVLAELCQVRAHAGERSHHLDAREVQDPVTGQIGVLLSERDVTAQVEAERALVAERERAEVAIAKERFLANMSHELRTPLNSVIGFAELLSRSALDGVQRSHVGRIAEAGQTLLSTINDVIEISELESGEVTLAVEPFEPDALLQHLLDAFRPAASDKGLGLHLEIDGAAPKRLVGDSERLGRAVAHYLSNALKFTDAGSVTVRLIALDDASLEISVSDTGPGIDPAIRPQLFQRFSPGDGAVNKRFSGSGLGLAISRELVGLMGGDVGVESQPGHGARFWLRVNLPLAEARDAMQDAGLDERPLLVLYADDHESNRALVQAMLNAFGHRCDVACDGAEAVAAVEAGAYDLVLMDIQMPGMDGVAATRAIRAAGHGLPILALTANTLSDQLATYAAAGMEDCIAKPVDMTELITKVTRWSGPGAGQVARSAA